MKKRFSSLIEIQKEINEGTLNLPELVDYYLSQIDKNKHLNAFLEDTNIENIPYSFALGKAFVQLSGTTLPKIYYIENKIVYKKVDYYELNQYQIEAWLESK